MNKSKRKFLKSLKGDIQSDVFYYFLMQEKLKIYKKDPNEFSFDHFQFEIRTLGKIKKYEIELKTLSLCIDKYDFDIVLKKGIEEFIKEKNQIKETLSEHEEFKEEFLNGFYKIELFQFLLLYDFKISREQIDRLFSLLFREKKVKIII